MDIELFSTPGLGDSSYLVASEGEAAIVDPQRDAWRFLAVAEARGWRVTHVVETHVHNDYLSGALEVRAATGATIVAPARGGYAFVHRGAEEGSDVTFGAVRLTAMATPGHTPEHLAWLVRPVDDAADAPPAAVFSGGSLLVGTAGRTDLLGPERTDELTELQAASLRRLAALPAATRILPTHGAGSFCSAGPASGAASTSIGAELFGNPVLRAIDGGAFAETLLAGLGRYPDYYARMAPLNRAGPRVLGGAPRPRALTPDDVELAAIRGVRIVDARPRLDFAAGHVPGALNVELDDAFAAYVGWLVPFDEPIALVVPEPAVEAAVEAATELLRVGYEHVEGFLDGGVDGWASSGRPVRSHPTLAVESLLAEVEAGGRPDILDVRQAGEWRADGTIPGSRTIFVADLPGQLAALPRDHELTVICKGGSRAAIAASLLDAAGIPVRAVARGGATGWVDRFAAVMARREG
ncbi:MAG: MBL fold metallo-hydrolase [Chloroflexi bacterium]|nr:MBL fold metallo-hydrolase [Chloroflexota bacterium]